MRPMAHAPSERRAPDRIPGPRRRETRGIEAVDSVAPAPGRPGTGSIEDSGRRPSELVPADGDSLGDALDVYLGAIGKLSLLTAEEEVVLAKAIVLGRQIVAEPERAIFSLWEWTRRETERETRASDPAYRLPFEVESDRIVRSALEAAAGEGSLPAPPDIGALGAGRPATDGALVREARRRLATIAGSLIPAARRVVGPHRRRAQPPRPPAPSRFLTSCAERLRSPKKTKGAEPSFVRSRRGPATSWSSPLSGVGSRPAETPCCCDRWATRPRRLAQRA
jgi:hypothetical protein